MSSNLELALKIKAIVSGVKEVEALAAGIGKLTQQSSAPSADITAALRGGLAEATAAIKELVSVLGGLTQSSRQIGDPTKVVRDGAEQTVKAVREVRADLDAVGQGAKRLEDPTAAARDGIEQTSKAVRDIGSDMAALGKDAKKLADPTSAAREGIQQTGKALQLLDADLGRAGRVKPAPDPTTALRRGALDTVPVLDRLASELGDLNTLAQRKIPDPTPPLREGAKQTASVLGELQNEIARLLTLGAIAKFVRDSVTAVRTAEASFKGLEAVANFTGAGIERAFEAATELAADGLLTVADASKSLQNLLSRGYNLDEAVSTITRLKDAAAFNRAAHLSMSQAVLTATEGLKNENSVLVDNAGVTKNVSVLWKEYADAIGKAVTELTQQDKVQAEVNGIMRETEAQAGNAAKAAAGLEGNFAKLHKSTVDLRTALGSALVPTLIKLAEVGSSLLNNWVRPFLGGIEIMGIKLAALAKSAADIMSGNFGALRSNFELADEMALEVVKRYEQGVIPAALQAKDAVDQEALARRRAAKEEADRRLGAEGAARRATKLRNDQVALTRASVEAQAKLIADGIARETVLLDRQKDDNLIRLRDYYARRAALQHQAADAEISRVQAEIDAQRKVLADLARPQPGIAKEDQEQDRLQALAKVRSLEADLIILERRRGDIAGAAAREQAQAEKDLAAELDRVQVALLQAQGRDADARTLELSQQYGDLIRRLQVEGDAAGEALVRSLINTEAARAQLDQLYAEYSRVLSAMQIEEERIGHDRDAGLKSEMQARREIVELHRRTSEELATLVPQMEALGESVGPDAAADVARIREEVRALGLVVDETASRMNAALESGLTQFFDDVMSGTKKGQNAFQAFGDSVVATLRRIIAEKAAMQFLDAVGGSAFGKAIAGIFHTGGIVGAASTTRMVSPLAFVGAPRYHSGGVLGLAPDEVPAILQRGEEVLTRDDPRHRNNGGGGGNVTVQMTINTPDADSFRRSQGRIARDMADAASRARSRHG